MAFVPLATREGIIGVLSAGREGAISETDVSLLTAIADIAANAIENSRLFESEHEQHQLSDALRDALSAGASLSSTLDFDEVLDHLLGAVEGILPYDDASILLVDHSGREAAIARTRGRAPGGEKTSQFFKDFRFNVTTTENLRWMAEHKQPLVIPDVTSYPGWITVEGTEAIRSWAGAPIIVNGKVIAFFSLAKNVINFYGPQHARLLEAFTGQASLAFQNARLFAETQSRLRFLTALHTIDTAIGASVDLRITLSIILENVTRELKVDAAAVALMNPHSRLLEYTASRGFRSRIVEGLRVKPGDGLVGQAAIQRHAVSSSDAGQVDGKSGSGTDSFKDEGFASQYAIPLIAKGQVQGILQLCHRTELNPGQDWLDFLDTLAGQAAIAIDNARMFENLQTSNLDLLLAYDATIQGWAQALDMRDRETEDHTRRVADITLTLAGAMSMNDSELEHIRRGALLHDIGKIGIPDIILLKPGPLTDEEWAIMRTHPVKAYEMLSPIAYLHPALDIPYCHHEKWDGSGYPRGLNGAQIPLAARIFAVVDVFDALTSDRPYRSAWSREQALDYIKEQTGKHFDPRVVEVFLKMKNQAA
jgi:HD-GYP domain-containing protein (c-di-GMP phosphodiesterase class II)